MSPDLNIEALQEVFKRYPGIRAVYLFGSHVTGRMHQESDLDLAIAPRTSEVRERKLDILADLVRAGFDHVDLIFLDIDDLVLKYEAIRHNRLIYQTEEFDRGALYSKIVRQYLDFLPYLEVQRAAYKRRILGQHGQEGSASQAPE
jgi:hypothetical protein